MTTGARVLVSAVAALLAAGCGSRTEHRLRGRTMGTDYHVTVVARGPSVEGLREAIDGRLDEVNLHLSTWIGDSEISRFNRSREVREELPASADFLAVMRAGAEIFELSGGAWDGTVNPLVDAWGFGPATALAPPSSERIAEALADVGFDKIEIRPHALVKLQPAVTVDLSSIAKGFGVDAVAEVLRKRGFRDFLVEIGGEVYAAGTRPDGRSWRVGIDRPDPEAGPDDLYAVVPLSDRALATSGDYRSFILRDGARRSHIIDPRTGQPVTTGVVSASVLAPTCMRADGLATAMMVMGAEAGIALIERLDGVEALLLVAGPGGALEERTSPGWRAEPPSR